MVRLVSLLVLLATTAAHADSPDPLVGAEHVPIFFENGRALYRLHKYAEAAGEFEKGYALNPLPELLLNIGLCYRSLGDLPRARAAYGRFLDEARPDHPRRRATVAVVADLDRAIALLGPPGTQTPAPASPPPTRKNRGALIAALVSVGVVVVVGAAVGIAFAAMPRDPTPSLGETVFRF